MVRRNLCQLKEHEGDSHQQLKLAIDAIQQQQSTIRDMKKEVLSLQRKQLSPTSLVRPTIFTVSTNFDEMRKELYSSPGGYKFRVYD